MPRDGNKPNQQQTKQDARVVGILTTENGKLQLHPSNAKGTNKNIDLAGADLGNAKEGDIVVAKNTSQGLQVTKVLGTRATPGILGLVSFYEQGGLSSTFNAAALKETAGMAVPELGNREDLRNIPLVTVDGPDSRDFDDAIYAEKKPDGGYHLIVAIADVSYYVRAGSEIDKEAYSRGNSYYFPDGVVPMLPEALSNGLCSLKPHEDRAVMVYHLDIDKDGNLINSKINRGLMRSAARLTYDELQAAKDGNSSSEQLKPLMDTVVKPLYDAYAILKQAALKRGKIDLHTVDNSAASHYVIEEFMILANVAGDKALEQSIHRFHPAPSDKKLEELGRFLTERGLKLPEDITDPRAFGPLVEQAKQRPDAHEIIRAIARAQSKAVYDAVNDGHYGLGLLQSRGQGYAHHTSPIRRYADLENHRLLVEAFNLGAGGITPSAKAKLQETAAHITDMEIIATKAERAADKRFSTKELEPYVGKTFKGRITGMVEGGVFVKVDGTDAEGYLRLSALPDDRYTVDKAAGVCKGENHEYRKGDELTVSVLKADSLTGDVLLSAGGTGKSQQGNVEAARAAGRRETAAALQNRVGEQLQGVITGVTKAGLFVRVDGTKSDGLVPFKNLPKDYYAIDPATKSCTGRDTGRTYKVGDKIGVNVTRVEVDRGNVYFAANDNAKGASRPQQRHKNRGPRHGR